MMMDIYIYIVNAPFHLGLSSRICLLCSALLCLQTASLSAFKLN